MREPVAYGLAIGFALMMVAGCGSPPPTEAVAALRGALDEVIQKDKPECVTGHIAFEGKLVDGVWDYDAEILDEAGQQVGVARGTFRYGVVEEGSRRTTTTEIEYGETTYFEQPRSPSSPPPPAPAPPPPPPPPPE